MSTTERPDEALGEADGVVAAAGDEDVPAAEAGDDVVVDADVAEDDVAGDDGVGDEPGDADDGDEPEDADEDADADVADEHDDEAADDDTDADDETDEEDEAGEDAVAFEPPEAMAQLLFVDVVLLLPSTHPVVILQEADPPYRELRIPVGGAEGIAIGYAARGLKTPRPLTHELLTNVLDTFGLTLEMVKITAVRGSAFRAEMTVSGRAGVEHLDCRPSDAIALALRQRLPVPIMAAPEVLSAAGGDPTGAN